MLFMTVTGRCAAQDVTDRRGEPFRAQGPSRRARSPAISRSTFGAIPSTLAGASIGSPTATEPDGSAPTHPGVLGLRPHACASGWPRPPRGHRAHLPPADDARVVRPDAAVRGVRGLRDVVVLVRAHG